MPMNGLRRAALHQHEDPVAVVGFMRCRAIPTGKVYQ
jgi:hypothetical protein